MKLLLTRSRPFIIITIIVVTGLLTTYGKDILILKSGEKIEGKILKKTADEVSIKYNVTPSITDIKSVPRNLILNIKSENPDEIAFKKLEALLPAGDLLTPADYTKLINSGLAQFPKQHPTSRYTERVRAMVKTLEDEKTKVEEGFQKFEGKWVSPEELAKDRYNFDASITFNEMKKKAESGKLLAALRTFDSLENNFEVSKAYPKAVEYARTKLMPEYGVILRRMQKRQPALQAERDRGVMSLVGNEKISTEQAIEREIGKWDKIANNEETSKTKWISVYAYDEKQIKNALKTFDKETTRLVKLDTRKIAEAADLISQAHTAKFEESYTAALDLVKAAQQRSRRSPYLKSLSKELMELEKEQEEKRKAEEAAASLEFITKDTPGEEAPATDEKK